MTYDWLWEFGGKSKWNKLIVVGIDGVFINKKQVDKNHERIMYFSKDAGLLSCLSRMHYKTKLDSFELQETNQRCYIHNHSNSVFNHVDKDDYDYIKFPSTKKAVMILETNFGDDYIIGVIIDQDKILGELLG